MFIGGLGEHVISLCIGLFLIVFALKPELFSKKNAQGHKKMSRLYLTFGIIIIILNITLIIRK